MGLEELMGEWVSLFDREMFILLDSSLCLVTFEPFAPNSIFFSFIDRV